MDELYTSFVGDGNISTNVSADTQTLMQTPDMSDQLKAQIANHPLYPNLLSASIECSKVGAPSEMASLLGETSRENQNLPSFSCPQIGTDPELDHFMNSYCEVLHKCKDEVSVAFEGATQFLNTTESQLNYICRADVPSGDSSGTRQELKEQVMTKYSDCLWSFGKEHMKKRKKSKLPEDATTTLLEWWNTHYRWPYPTEDEKNMLSETTGLDQKQVNNWFINQRKRHWRPSEEMRFALMEDINCGTDAFDHMFS